MREMAEKEERPVPALCPRIRLHLTDAPRPEDQRVAGEGSLDQIRQDLADLEELGCSYVLLDTYRDDLEAVKNNEEAWRFLTVLAERALDLKNETLR